MYKNEFEGISEVEVTYGNLEDKISGGKKVGIALAVAAGGGIVAGYLGHDMEDVIPDLFRFPDFMDRADDTMDRMETFMENQTDYNAELKSDVVDIERDINVLDSKVDRLQDDHTEIVDIHSGTNTGGDMGGDTGGDMGGDTGGVIDIDLDGEFSEAKLGIYLDDTYGGDHWVSRGLDKFVIWNRDGALANNFGYGELEDLFEAEYGGDWTYDSESISQVTFKRN